MEEHGIEVGLEEGIMWLPTHVLVEACDSKDSKEILRKKKQAQFDHNVPAQPKQVQQPKPISRSHHRANFRSNGGHGMQAVFLGPNLKPSGTGVFLPRPAPYVDIQFRQLSSSNVADIQFTQPSNKPGGTPVLLPARVVQALNLNVHELGAQLTAKSQKGSNNESKSANPKKHKSGKKSPTQCCVVSNNRNNSPEIFLPKEWTY